MLKGIRGVQLDNRNVLRAQGPRTKYFGHFLLLKELVII